MTNFIRGRCRTNLDGFEHAEWPTAFAAVPRVGERVRAASRLPEHRYALMVCGVTHYQDERGEPAIDVELHR